MNESSRWLDNVRGNDSIREVARKIGTTHATLNRQVRDDAIAFELVREISHAYRRPVLADLVRLGHLTADDIGANSIETALEAASDEQLVVQIGKRLGVADMGTIFDKPVSEAIAEVDLKKYFRDRASDSSASSVALAASEPEDWQQEQEDVNE